MKKLNPFSSEKKRYIINIYKKNSIITLLALCVAIFFPYTVWLPV